MNIVNNAQDLNESFRYAMLALIQQGSTNCDDRVTLFFNDIEILCQFYEKELSHKEFRDLCIRAQRYEEIKGYGKNHSLEGLEQMIYEEKIALPSWIANAIIDLQTEAGDSKMIREEYREAQAAYAAAWKLLEKQGARELDFPAVHILRQLEIIKTK